MGGIILKKLELIAVDIGAGSGRGFLSQFDGHRISSSEICRFENNQTMLGDTLYWDFINIYKNVLDAISKAGKNCSHNAIKSIGIDTWGADFGLIDKYGSLISNPVSYRDSASAKMAQYAYEKIPPFDLFKINSTKTYDYCALFKLLHLYKFKKESAIMTGTFLPVPNLINYFLTGEKNAEASILTGTQFFDVGDKIFLKDILEKFNIPADILPQIVEPGKITGKLKKSISDELGVRGDLNVCMVCGHDSASAAVGIPFQSHEHARCFMLSGTWAVIGIETDAPIVNRDIYDSDFTNWVTYKSNIIFLKIFNCFYFIQECKKVWEKESGENISYDDLLGSLYEEKIQVNALIDIANYSLLNTANNIVENISDFLRLTGQAAKDTVKDITIAIFVSAVLEAKLAFEDLKRLSLTDIKSLHIGGGGSQNRKFCQWIADCLGIEVIAGNPESTINGNLVVQLMALGEISSLDEGRKIIEESFKNIYFYPDKNPVIDWVYLEEKYRNLKNYKAAK